MVRKSECAYLCNGKCLLCKGACAIRHDDMVCADGVRRAVHHSMAGLPVRCRPFMGARGRHYGDSERFRGRGLQHLHVQAAVSHR